MTLDVKNIKTKHHCRTHEAEKRPVNFFIDTQEEDIEGF